jgi:hypothetical protein
VGPTRPTTSYHYAANSKLLSVISGFRRDIHQTCGLLGYYGAPNGNPLPTFPGNVSVPTLRLKNSNHILFFLDFLTLKDGTYTQYRNVGIGLLIDAALYPRRAQISTKCDFTKHTIVRPIPSEAFCHATPCRLVNNCRRFETTVVPTFSKSKYE